MEKTTRHPIHIHAEKLAQALIVNGFILSDAKRTPEIERSEWAIPLYYAHNALNPAYAQSKQNTDDSTDAPSTPMREAQTPIRLEHNYALRSSVIAAQLPAFARIIQRFRANAQPSTCNNTFLASHAASIPICSLSGTKNDHPYSEATDTLARACKIFSVGEAYNRTDNAYAAHLRLEGIVLCNGISLAEYHAFWNSIAKRAYGIDAHVEFLTEDAQSYRVQVTCETKTFTLAYTGKATAIARGLLGALENDDVWCFTIDADEIAQGYYALDKRIDLYNPCVSFLDTFSYPDAAFGTWWQAKATDLLRAAGFHEFRGMRLYEANCYKKMNMIQESWDTNNRGVQLQEPIQNYCGLPTVLTPALEEALAVNWRAGEKECRIFEFAHIYVPGSNGDTPTEKIALSFGGYGDTLDKRTWKQLVDTFLTDLGIRNHFFIPTDRAIAYNTSDCWLVMDEHMRYLESNFGSISPIALANHGIEAPAYMAQFEFDALESKAQEEFGISPHEYR